MQNENNVVVMFIGDTGAGKSSVGNLYLKDKAFEASQKAEACTLVPKHQSRIVNGTERIVIDTEGFDDGDHITEDQIEKLAHYLKTFPIGINAIGVVIQYSRMRLTRGVKDVIKFIYDAFGDVILSHLCIIWTFSKYRPEDWKVRNEDYKPKITNYLCEISGKKEIPNIPFYYVNCDKPDKDFVVENMTQFHGWAVSRQKFSSSEIKEATLGYTTEEEKEEKVKVETFTDGNVTYQKYVDRVRHKIIPNGNKNDIHYSDWEITKEYQEKLEEVKEEFQYNVLSGYTYEDGNKYEIRQDLVREVRIFYQTGKQKEGHWAVLKENKVCVGKTTTHEEVIEKSWVEIVDGGYNQIIASFKQLVKTNPDGETSFGDPKEIPGSRRINFVPTPPVVIVKKHGGLFGKVFGKIF